MIDVMTTTRQTPDAQVDGPRATVKAGLPRRRTATGWRRTAAALCAALALFAAPATSSAADDSEVTTDGRLEGYQQSVAITGGGAVTGTWMLFFALAVVGVSVMFKDAKRSHGD